MSKILISLPAELLAEVDAYCQKFHFNRSELIRSVLREELKNVASAMNEESN